jgi:DNA-binding IclR family transcriptional regulator
LLTIPSTVPSPSRHSRVESALTAAALAARLRNRLDELDAERRRIAEALRVLEPAPGRRRRQARPTLLEALRTSPGARRSMLALVCGLPMTSVSAELDTLAEARIVERDGLGWRLREAGTGG